MFRITLFLVVSSLQYLLYFRARRWVQHRFGDAQGPRAVLASLFIIFNIPFVAELFFRPAMAALPSGLASVLARPFYIWHAATLALALIVIAGIAIVLPFRGISALLAHLPWTGPRVRKVAQSPTVQRFDASRRVFLRHGMEGVTALTFGGAAYGVLVGKSAVDFTSARIQISNLPAALDGFTIGLMSDIHSSSFMTKPEMDEYVRALLSLQADLVVVPGDFVNSQTEEVYPFAESFSALHAPCGVYGVMGNHDFFAPDPEQVAREVNDCGVKLLRNDRVIIEKNGARFVLMGIDDVGRHDQAAQLMRSTASGVPELLPRVLLCHRPYFLDQAAELGLDLVLSGHTHGGQIVLGHIGSMALTPASLASPYVWGMYRHRNTQMYVSRGIGTVGLPLRVNCPPEITRIILSRA